MVSSRSQTRTSTPSAFSKHNSPGCLLEIDLLKQQVDSLRDIGWMEDARRIEKFLQRDTIGTEFILVPNLDDITFLYQLWREYNRTRAHEEKWHWPFFDHTCRIMSQTVLKGMIKVNTTRQPSVNKSEY